MKVSLAPISLSNLMLKLLLKEGNTVLRGEKVLDLRRKCVFAALQQRQLTLEYFFPWVLNLVQFVKSSIDDRHWLKHVLWEMQLKILLERDEGLETVKFTARRLLVCAHSQQGNLEGNI